MQKSPSHDPLDRLDAIVRLHRADLCGVARGEGLGAEEALECVQDALCTFLSRELPPPGTSVDGDVERLGPEHIALASLKTIVRNAARNFRRRHRRAKPHEDLADHEPLAPSTVEDLVAHAEEVVRLRACVAELCSVQRAVVMLRLLEEQSGEDTAAALGITRNHVDVLVHRAKGALRVCMRHPEARAGHGLRARAS